MSWTEIDADRVLIVMDGRDTILLDRFRGPVKLLVHGLRIEGEAPARLEDASRRPVEPR